MQLRQLAAFVAAADRGSFAAAARELGVVQPAVSQSVRRLEEELQLVLLTRTTRSVTLTPAGEALIDAARAVLHAERRLQERAAGLANGDAGIIRLATTSGTAALLRDLIATLEQRRPDAQVRLHRTRRTKAAAVLDGELDAALVRSPPTDARLAAVEVSCHAWLAVLSADHPQAGPDPVHLSQLAEHPFVALTRPDEAGHNRGPEELRQALSARGLELRVGPTAASPDELLALVATPPAWTLLTETMRPQLDAVGLAARPLVDAMVPARVWLIHRMLPSPLVADLAAAASDLRAIAMQGSPPVTLGSTEPAGEPQSG